MDTIVIDDPDAPELLPHGCIGAASLRSLAYAMEQLEQWHQAMKGKSQDAPCLRRIEATADDVVAHVSSGASVGGDWYRLHLTTHGWVAK